MRRQWLGNKGGDLTDEKQNKVELPLGSGSSFGFGNKLSGR